MNIFTIFLSSAISLSLSHSLASHHQDDYEDFLSSKEEYIYRNPGKRERATESLTKKTTHSTKKRKEKQEKVFEKELTLEYHRSILKACVRDKQHVTAWRKNFSATGDRLKILAFVSLDDSR